MLVAILVVLVLIAVGMSLWMSDTDKPEKRDNRGMLKCPYCNWKSKRRICDHCGCTIPVS
jgi:hypothetical protein